MLRLLKMLVLPLVAGSMIAGARFEAASNAASEEICLPCIATVIIISCAAIFLPTQRRKLAEISALMFDCKAAVHLPVEHLQGAQRNVCGRTLTFLHQVLCLNHHKLK